jgi:hypothetical protein
MKKDYINYSVFTRLLRTDNEMPKRNVIVDGIQKVLFRGKNLAILMAMLLTASFTQIAAITSTATRLNTGVITGMSVDVTAKTDNKSYDGTTVSAVVPTVGTLAAGDAVDVAPIQTYDNKNVGTAKMLTPSGLTIKNAAGADVTANYTINYVAVNTGVITAKSLNVFPINETKIYDGTNISTAVPIVEPLAVGDVINTPPTQEFHCKFVETGKFMIASGLTIKDADNNDVTSNYAIIYNGRNSSVILPKQLDVTAKTDSKIYDGTTASALVPTVGTLVVGDFVDAAPVQAYDNKNVGTAKTLVPSGLTLKDADNTDVTYCYNINYVADNTGIITKAFANVIVTPYIVSYNGSAHTATAIVTGVKGEDLLDLIDLSATTHNEQGDYTDSWYFAGNQNYHSDSGTVINHISISTNTEQVIDDKLNVLVYPNPSVSFVNFKFALKYPLAVTIDIVDVNGMQIDHSITNCMTGENNVVITYKNGLAPGTYIYRLKSVDDIIIGKIIINK